MGIEAIEFIYLVCFFLGLGFAIISGLLSGVFSGGVDAHVDVGGGHDLGGHGDGAIHFPLLSPVTIAMFISTFGGAGLIFKKALGWPAAGHIPAAGACAVAVALAVAWLMYKLFSVTQGSSESSAEEAVGVQAEVTVPIPHEGLGEIAYTLKETRFTNPARTEDGKELPARTLVKVVRLVGNTYIVQKIS